MAMELAVPPIHKHASDGNKEGLIEELDKGVDINKLDDQGNTALHQAALNGHLDICKYLLKSKNILILPNHRASTPLHYLVRKRPKNKRETGNLKRIMKRLVQRLDINHTNRSGEAAMHEAGLGGNLEAIILLLQYGADINIQTKRGETPLHYCARSNSLQAAQEILSKVSKPDYVDIKGINGSAIDIARTAGYTQLSKFLEEWKGERQEIRQSLIFPRELWLKFFSFLGPEELVEACFVCKELQRIASDEELWRNLRNRYTWDLIECSIPPPNHLPQQFKEPPPEHNFKGFWLQQQKQIFQEIRGRIPISLDMKSGKPSEVNTISGGTSKSKRNSTRKTVRIQVLGYEASGKTSLIQRFCKNKFSSIGNNKRETTRMAFINDSTVLSLHVLDCPRDAIGNHRYNFSYRVQGYIFAFDSTQRASFERMKRWIENLYRYRDDTNFCIIVAGTKTDMVSKREVLFDEAKHYCETLYMTYIETSAKTGRNVELLFKLMASFVLNEILYL